MEIIEKIVLIGGGGHCKVIISILKEIGKFEIIGISDSFKIGSSVLGIPVKFTDEDLPQLFKSGIKNAVIAIGSTGNPSKRIEIFKSITQIGFNLPVIISPHALISEEVEVGCGTVVMSGVIINSGTKIGRNCIINTGAIIDHDCSIGDYVHIAPGVSISGYVFIDSGSHIGTGASVIDNISIGNNSIIGAGAVVIGDIPSFCTAVGVPAKIIKYQKFN